MKGGRHARRGGARRGQIHKRLGAAVRAQVDVGRGGSLVEYDDRVKPVEKRIDLDLYLMCHPRETHRAPARALAIVDDDGAAGKVVVLDLVEVLAQLRPDVVINHFEVFGDSPV